MRFSTVVTDPIKANMLTKTAEKNNISIDIICLSEMTRGMDKFRAWYNFVKSVEDDNEIICCVDGYDVVVGGGPEEILEKFKKYNCNILMGATLDVYPLDCRNILDYSNTKYACPNTGGFMGYKRDLVKFFEWRNYEYYDHVYGIDQRYIIDYYTNNKDTVRLDSACQVFQNMILVNWKELEYKNGRFYNNIMGTYPCFFHFNGTVCFRSVDDINIMPIMAFNPEKFKEYDQMTDETQWPHPQK
jgi:hypothetical protein